MLLFQIIKQPLLLLELPGIFLLRKVRKVIQELQAHKELQAQEAYKVFKARKVTLVLWEILEKRELKAIKESKAFRVSKAYVV
jgi:hypothetical protein